MKIHESQPAKWINPYIKQQPDVRQVTKQSKSSRKDEVSISDDAFEMAQVSKEEKTVDGGQERITKLDQIKQAIQDGTYHVNHTEVAKKIYESFVRTSK